MKDLSLLKSLLLCSVFLLAAGSNSNAQTPQTPADCKAGCTSNDVQIIRAYLVDPTTLQQLSGSFSCSGTVNVKLALELTTNTPRVGVTVYANVKNFSGGVAGATLVTKKECFSTTLNQPTNKVVFSGVFGWPCGTPIALTDVFLGWGTGNTDFCQNNTAFRCPGTPSKCFSLPPGQYIAIEIPTSQNTSRSRCPDAVGGNTATFNLTALNGEVSNNATNVTITWYSNSGLTTQIGTPGAYSTASSTAYAKVTNNSNPSVYSTATATLTVLNGPALSISNPSAVCAPATVNITASAVTTGSTLPAGTSLSYWTDATATTSLSAPTTAGDGTYYIKAVTNTTPACSDIQAVVATVRATPALTITNPDAVCAPATVNLTAAAVTAGSTLPAGSSLSYWTNSGATTSLSTPSAAAAGTYYIKAATSGTPACADIEAVTVAVNSKPDRPTVCAVQPNICGPALGSLTITSPTGGSYQYSIDSGQHWQSAATFSNVAAGSNPNILVKNGTGCISTVASCSDAGACTQTARIAADPAKEGKRALPAEDSKEALSVRLYPNPFRNTVDFTFTAPVSGKVSLEVYSNTGRQLAAINYGDVTAGTTRVLRYSPRQKQTALQLYRLRIGQTTVSGKMIQRE